MNSRERVRKAINHQEPDRVPIDIGGSKASAICIDAYVKLIEYLNIDIGTPKVYESFSMLARIDEPVRKLLHCDIIELENIIEAWELENTDWKKWTTSAGSDVLMPGSFNPVVDERGYLYIQNKNGKILAYKTADGLYFERYCETTMSEEIKFMDPEEWKRQIPLYTDEHLRKMEEIAKDFYNNTEYSIHGGFLKGGLGTNGIFAGHTITDWLCLLLTEQDYVFSILQATAEKTIENLKIYLEAVGKYIDTIFISGTDFGTQKGPLFDPSIFGKLYVPNYKIINDYVHNNTNVKTYYHSCGSVFDFMKYFIEAGMDIINPVQTNAANMDPSELKRKFGDQITFWGGGVETQTILPFGTIEEVREQVKERIRIFAPGGGFIFNQVHNIQFGVPPENIIAMVDTAYEFGHYPIKI